MLLIVILQYLWTPKNPVDYYVKQPAQGGKNASLVSSQMTLGREGELDMLESKAGRSPSNIQFTTTPQFLYKMWPLRLQEFTGDNTINLPTDIQHHLCRRHFSAQYKNQIDFWGEGRDIPKCQLQCHIWLKQEFYIKYKENELYKLKKSLRTKPGAPHPLFLTFLTVQVIQIQLLRVSHALTTQY